MGFRLLREIPDGCKVNTPSLLYNQASFLKSNNDLPQLHFYWVNTSESSIEAHVAFNIEEGEAVSGIKAPFGGLEVSETLAPADLVTFIIFLEKALKEQGIRFLRISQAPSQYFSQEKINAALEDLKYTIKANRKYQLIPVLKEVLNERMRLMEQRRIRKCLKAGFTFRAVKVKNLLSVYSVLNDWRTKSAKPLSMEWSELAMARKQSPEAYLPFGIFDGNKLVAASIAIRVSKDVLYHFYPGHDPDYNNFSPMVMLVDEMHSWCYQNDFKFLDLGTSYVSGKMSQSLFRFKSHIGGIESQALVFRKTLSLR